LFDSYRRPSIDDSHIVDCAYIALSRGYTQDTYNIRVNENLTFLASIIERDCFPWYNKNIVK